MLFGRRENVVREFLGVSVRVVREKSAPVSVFENVVESGPVSFLKVVHLACYVCFSRCREVECGKRCLVVCYFWEYLGGCLRGKVGEERVKQVVVAGRGLHRFCEVVLFARVVEKLSLWCVGVAKA